VHRHRETSRVKLEIELTSLLRLSTRITKMSRMRSRPKTGLEKNTTKISMNSNSKTIKLDGLEDS